MERSIRWKQSNGFWGNFSKTCWSSLLIAASARGGSRRGGRKIRVIRTGAERRSKAKGQEKIRTAAQCRIGNIVRKESASFASAANADRSARDGFSIGRSRRAADFIHA